MLGREKLHFSFHRWRINVQRGQPHRWWKPHLCYYSITNICHIRNRWGCLIYCLTAGYSFITFSSYSSLAFKLLVENQSSTELLIYCCEAINGVAILQSRLAISYKLNISSPYDPTIMFLDIYPYDLETHTYDSLKRIGYYLMIKRKKLSNHTKT